MTDNTPSQKWLFLLSYAPEHRSGAGISVHFFAKYASTRNVLPTILTLNRKLKENSDEIIGGVRIRRIPYFNHNNLTKIISLLWIQFYYLKYCLENQVIWITGSKIIGMEFMMFYSLLFRRKIVFRSTMREADDLTSILGTNYLLYCIRKFLFSRITIYYSLHPEFSEKFLFNIGSHVPVFESVQGVDFERFGQFLPAERNKLRKKLKLPENKLIIVSLSVITKRKGLAELVDILEKVDFDYNLIILGEKEFGKNHFLENKMAESIGIQQKAKETLGKKVVFKGWAENPEEYLACADIFISGGIREGIPNACLQAMTSGLPCLVKYNPGYGKMLGQKEGAVLLYTNETEFLEHLYKLYRDIDYRTKISNASREFARNNFPYSKIFEEILTLLNKSNEKS